MVAPAPLPSVAAVPEPSCPNCGNPGATRYCANCGQKLENLRLSTRQFAREFLEYVARVDGKLLRTLLCLLTRPGFLTREYLAGRRASYEKPFRLFVAATVLSFLGMSMSPRLPVVTFTTQGSSQDLRFQVSMGDDAQIRTRAETEDAFKKLSVPRPEDGVFMTRIRKVLARGLDSLLVEIKATWIRLGPKLALAALPLLALVLMGLYRRRGMLYSEHFVFALHVRAFAALVGLPNRFVSSSVVTGLIALTSLLYLVRASRVVYGVTWWGALWRSGVLFWTEFVFQILTVALVLAATFFTL